jgi:predicted permease
MLPAMLRATAVRLLRSPGHSLLATGILAVGFGATIAIAAMLHSVLLKPLPFREPARLVQISETHPAAGIAYADTSSLTAADWMTESQSFESIAGVDASGRGASIIADQDSLWVRSAYVTWTFFRTLGVAPARGRTFTPPPFDDSVVISHRLWMTRFGGREDILNLKIRIDGPSWPIVGVMPEGFGFPGQTDIWRLSQSLAPRGDGWRGFRSEGRNLRTFSVVARLKPGVALGQAQAEMTLIGARISQENPDTNGEWGVSVRPLAQAMTAGITPILGAVSLASILLLVMTAVNAVNLSLARGWLRQTEVAVHAALGASPARLFTMFLVERALIAVAGLLGGVLVGTWLIGGLRSSAAAVVPRVSEVSVRTPEILFIAGLALALAILEALVLQRRFGRAQLGSPGVRAAERSATPVRLHGLVSVEVALTVVLLVVAAGALAIVREFKAVDRGYGHADLLVAQMVPDIEAVRSGATQPGASEFMKAQIAESTVRAIAALPGVSNAGIAVSAPFRGESWSSELVTAARTADPSQGVTADFQIITNSYFQTLGVRLVEGRAFDDRDRFTVAQLAENDKQLGSVILTAALSRRLFGQSSPLGQEVNAVGRRVIVGVVDDARPDPAATTASPAFFVPIGQRGGPYYQTLVARMVPGASVTASAIIQSVRSVQPQAAVFNVKRADDLIDEAIPAERVSAQLMRVFGAIALLVSVAGLGTLAGLLVRSSKRAIAIRLMLGAPSAHVIEVVTRPAVWSVALGVTSGVVISLGVARLLIARGYWRAMPDMMLVAIAVSLVVIAAALAVALPVRRALQVDPLVTLKEL